MEVGDWVKIDGIESRPELNRTVVEVLSEAAVDGRWVVGVVGQAAPTFSVATSKLHRVRPAS